MVNPLKKKKKSTKMIGGEPIEHVKKILFMKGKSSSQLISDSLRDLAMISKPNNVVFQRNNDILPFEDSSSLEFLAGKNECGIVAFGSHTKKRPNNLVLARFFENQLLDMYELGIEQFQSLLSIKGDKKSIGSKPLMLFLGDEWEQNETYTNLQNFFLDFFRGYKPEKLSLAGVDHVISCSIKDEQIFVRVYYVKYASAAGSSVPDLCLSPMGPNFNLTLRRHQAAPADLLKEANKKPKTIIPTKVKNIKHTEVGETVARIHMKKQNLDNMKIRRSSALRNHKEGEDEPAKKKMKMNN